MGRALFYMATGMLAVGVTACDGGPANLDGSQDDLVGTWVSAGENLAPGLTVGPFGTDSLIVTFRDDGGYEVTQWAAGAEVHRLGTYEAGPGEPGEIRSLSMVQTSPSELTYEGILQLSDGSMRYEIIQVEPSLRGVDPPTTERGFGSTRVNHIPTGSYWIQYFERRD